MFDNRTASDKWDDNRFGDVLIEKHKQTYPNADNYTLGLSSCESFIDKDLGQLLRFILTCSAFLNLCIFITIGKYTGEVKLKIPSIDFTV